MSYDWSFGDDQDLDQSLVPARHRCYNCLSPAPDDVPAVQARCEVCGFHLHTCPNCALYNGIACMIREPAFWSDSAVIGKFCTSFVWREFESEAPKKEQE